MKQSLRSSTALAALLLLLLSALFMTAPAAAEDEGPAGLWSVPVKVDSASAGRDLYSLGLETGPEGRLYLSWLDDREKGNDCYVAASADGGVTWGQEVMLTDVDQGRRTEAYTCDLAVDEDGRVYVGFTERRIQGWLARWTLSRNGGSTFSEPTDANPQGTGDLFQEHVSIAASPLGPLYVLYLDDATTGETLKLVRSDDGLVPRVPIDVEADPVETVQHVQGEIVAAADGTLYVAYGYKSPGEAGIKLAVRGPSDHNFTVRKAFVVKEAVPRELRPALAVSDGGVVEIAFVNTTGGNSTLWHVRSGDGGSTFGGARRVWGALSQGEVQLAPDLAFDGKGRVNVVWSQGGPDSIRVLFSLSHDGRSFTAPSEVSDGWDAEEMGPRGWEGVGAVEPLEDGSVAVAFSARLNNSVGVHVARLVNEPPVVAITFPFNGALVEGDVTLLGTASDPRGTTGVSDIYVSIGGADPVRLPGASAWELEFDSRELPDGVVLVEAWAADGFKEGPATNITLDVDNNLPPDLYVGSPQNGSEHVGSVRIAGTSHDDGGFTAGWAVEWSLDQANWTAMGGLGLLDEQNLDWEVTLDLSDRPSGPYVVYVRATDGDKYSPAGEVSFDIVNKPDLHIDEDDIEWLPPHPEHLETITFTVHVENRGVVQVNGYDAVLFRGSQQIGVATGSTLGPGESKNLVIEWEGKGGNNTLRLVLDHMMYVDELDEDDNEVLFHLEVAKPPEEDEGPAGTTYFLAAVGVLIAVVVVYAVVRIMSPPKGEEEEAVRYVDETGEVSVEEEPPRGGEGPPPQA